MQVERAKGKGGNVQMVEELRHLRITNLKINIDETIMKVEWKYDIYLQDMLYMLELWETSYSGLRASLPPV